MCLYNQYMLCQPQYVFFNFRIVWKIGPDAQVAPAIPSIGGKDIPDKLYSFRSLIIILSSKHWEWSWISVSFDPYTPTWAKLIRVECVQLLLCCFKPTATARYIYRLSLTKIAVWKKVLKVRKSVRKNLCCIAAFLLLHNIRFFFFLLVVLFDKDIEVAEGNVIVRDNVHNYPVESHEVAILVSSILSAGTFVHRKYGYPIEEGGFTVWEREDCVETLWLA